MKYLEITGSIEEKVGGFEVPVQDVGTVYVLQTSQYLVQEVTHMVIAQSLSLKCHCKVSENYQAIIGEYLIH